MHRLRLALLILALLAAACSDDTASVQDEATSDDDETDDIAVETEDDAAVETDDDADETDPADDADTGDDADVAMDPYAGYVSELYADAAVWVCRPDRDDVCDRSLDVTIVEADGTLEVVPVAHAVDAPIDCFYAYPTISADPTPNSDLEPHETQEIYVTWQQAARFGAVCDVYAPVYRSNTLGSLAGTIEAPEGVNTYEIAYADVADAFKHFIANDSEGRGFVLIGHSQGAGMLRNLIAEEIDGDQSLRERMVSAMLFGSGVAVDGEGAFENIGGCTTPDQVNCVVSYATFRETAPPPATSIFGRSGDAPALCTNPAALGGGDAPLDPRFLTGDDVQGVFGGGVEPFADPDAAPTITTSWVTYPDFLRGECIDDGTFGYLTLRVFGDPGDPRADDIRGDLTPQWGLHLVDVNVALGDLVELVAAQAAAYGA